MASCFLDCQPRQLNRCGALLCRGDYEIGRQQLPPPVCPAYGFIMLLISQSHEDENTDLMLSSVFVLNPFLGDIARFFESGRSFCGISNTGRLGSILVMIRRDGHWLVRACAFHFQQEKRTFPSQHKDLVSVPSYFRFTSRPY